MKEMPTFPRERQGDVETSPSVSPLPIDPLHIRLELLRNEVGVEMTIVAGLADVAVRCIALGEDDLLARSVTNARERMRLALAALKQLETVRAAAALSAEAAKEWRADRDRRRA